MELIWETYGYMYTSLETEDKLAKQNPDMNQLL